MIEDASIAFIAGALTAQHSQAQPNLLAVGTEIDLKRRGGCERTLRTLRLGNDNDFLEQTEDPTGKTILNPNQFFVFGVTEADLGGSQLVPQQIWPFAAFGF